MHWYTEIGTLFNINLDNVQMNAVQLRMARAALGWGVRDLGRKAGVTANTVTRIENGADAKQSTIDRLRRALEAAGVEFTNGDQPGVRLRKAAVFSANPDLAVKRTRSREAGHAKSTKATEKRK
jgi:transcriptional regulator with XRE-family HTH domain